MYKSFGVENFRCFRNKLTIKDIQRVNLIAGKNNVGKTALLESMFIHSGTYNPALTLTINGFRGLETFQVELGSLVETPWDSIFSDFDIEKEVEFSALHEKTGHSIVRLRVVRDPEDLRKIDQYVSHPPAESNAVYTSSEAAHVLELEFQKGKQRGRKHYMIFDQTGSKIRPIPPSPPYRGIFVSARARFPPNITAERFGKLETIGKEDVLLRTLQVVEPRLRRLTIVVVGRVPLIHGDIGLHRLVPLAIMGEGMLRLTSLILAIGDAMDGVVFLDEIENSLHHSILIKVWRAIAEAAREFNTQVFATTHSLECIKAAHEAFKESKPYDFRLHRLEHVKDTIKITTYRQKTLEAALETGLEVR